MCRLLRVEILFKAEGLEHDIKKPSGDTIGIRNQALMLAGLMDAPVLECTPEDSTVHDMQLLRECYYDADSDPMCVVTAARAVASHFPHV
jgi:hypothetical protein